MKILVCSRVSIPAIGRTIPEWDSLRKLGHEVVVTGFSSGTFSTFHPDVILCMGVGAMEETYTYANIYPTAKLYVYHWDCYAWVWKNPRPGEYNYQRYGELLSKAEEVWVPSECTGWRTTQWWGLRNWKVILSSCPWWRHDNVSDQGYALCTLRKIPDSWCYEFEKACRELKIPHQRPDHKLSYEEYKDVVAGCRFLVDHYEEASTGGLTLLEGYYHGKPCLVNDSEWNGARDYFGSRAWYFHHDDQEDFRSKLKWMYENPPSISPDYRRWIEEKYSDTRMCRDILERIS